MMAGCTRGNDAKGTVSANDADFAAFDQVMHEADSLYNNMDFRLAYDLYLQQLDTKGAKADAERMLNVLNSLCMAKRAGLAECVRPFYPLFEHKWHRYGAADTNLKKFLSDI